MKSHEYETHIDHTQKLKFKFTDRKTGRNLGVSPVLFTDQLRKNLHSIPEIQFPDPQAVVLTVTEVNRTKPESTTFMVVFNQQTGERVIHEKENKLDISLGEVVGITMDGLLELQRTGLPGEYGDLNNRSGDDLWEKIKLMSIIVGSGGKGDRYRVINKNNRIEQVK